ncbi:PRD domain [Streptobacillus moniliformis]|nr:PRD domain [Streptobacillus moniliformis]
MKTLIKILSKDKIFREELLHHIKPAIYRVKKNISLGDSISKEVMKEYEEVYNRLKNL